ncbi:MAG: hypothetical protein JST72_12815 [Bacteroidetes bacterium]|nr:hypothetical protein [Bacteroidota bacterium]
MRRNAMPHDEKKRPNQEKTNMNYPLQKKNHLNFTKQLVLSAFTGRPYTRKKAAPMRQPLIFLE